MQRYTIKFSKDMGERIQSMYLLKVLEGEQTGEGAGR